MKAHQDAQLFSSVGIFNWNTEVYAISAGALERNVVKGQLIKKNVVMKLILKASFQKTNTYRYNI